MTRDHDSAAPDQPSTGAALVRSGGLLLAGLVVFEVATALHPGHQAMNHHAAVFAEYAASRDWIVVHLAQFLAALIVLSGLVALRRAMTGHEELLQVLALGAASATAAAIAANMPSTAWLSSTRSTPGPPHHRPRSRPASPPLRRSAGSNGEPTRSSSSCSA